MLLERCFGEEKIKLLKKKLEVAIRIKLKTLLQ